MLKPQAFGVTDNSRGKSCALLAAANAVGLKSLHFLNPRWPWPWTWSELTKALCPACGYFLHVGALIAHLNDQHRWTREQIADWVATVEPCETTDAGITPPTNAVRLSTDQPVVSLRD